MESGSDKGTKYNCGSVSLGSSGTTVSIDVGFTPRMFAWITYTSRQDGFIYLSNWSTTKVLGAAYVSSSNNAANIWTIGDSAKPPQQIGSTTIIKATTSLANKTAYWIAATW